MRFLFAILALFFISGCSKNKNMNAENLNSVGSKVSTFDIQKGQYFLYTDNYTCNLNGKVVLSYKDSIYFDDNKLCKTGDVCSTEQNCVDIASLNSLEINNDQLEVRVFGETYLYGKDLSQTNGIPDFKAERKIASIADPNKTSKSKNLLIIYLMWSIAFGMMFYLHAPEH